MYTLIAKFTVMKRSMPCQALLATMRTVRLSFVTPPTDSHTLRKRCTYHKPHLAGHLPVVLRHHR